MEAQVGLGQELPEYRGCPEGPMGIPTHPDVPAWLKEEYHVGATLVILGR